VVATCPSDVVGCADTGVGDDAGTLLVDGGTIGRDASVDGSIGDGSLGADASGDVVVAGGCGCRAASGSGAGSSGWLGVAVALLVARRARRRTAAHRRDRRGW
jgi:MYXO-CTERM domain-containing protein